MPKSKKYTSISFLIAFVLASVVVSLIILNIKYSHVKGKLLFDFFVLLVLAERIWETFYTTKEKEPRKLEGDWTWVLTIIAYLVVGISFIIEFFVFSKSINIIISAISGVIFISAFILRLWSVRTLGNQWTTHAVGRPKLDNIELIRKGPYLYVRHPIYLATILETLTLPLIPGCYFAFFISIFLNLPIYLIRAHFEEKTSINRFGEIYLKYKKEVPMWLPFKLNKY